MHAILTTLSSALARVELTTWRTFANPGSNFSLPSLISAFCIATATVVTGRWRRGRKLRWRSLLQALSPHRALMNASGKADIGFFFFNTFSAGGLIGWGLVSQGVISSKMLGLLTSEFGRSEIHATGASAALAATLATFISYETAYWLDHWLSHKVDFLWEIHKVHHTAEALSPLTNFRVHPLESLKFYNIVAIITGSASGLVEWALGSKHGRIDLFGADASVFLFMFTIAHLQHSHVWICWRGLGGRLFMSPAHHQIHHSTDERHFGRNLGSALAIFDWLFGTLYIPTKARQQLVFGVQGEGAAAHTVTGALISPMMAATRRLVRGGHSGNIRSDPAYRSE